MNEELISQIVRRILSEPAFQGLLQGNKEGSLEAVKAVKLDALVLLNYVPDFEKDLTALRQQFGADYTLSILPSEQVYASKPTLPEGLTWITPKDALSKTTWRKILIPTCSPNTLAKAALGIRDNPISEMIGRAMAQGIPTVLVTEYLGFTAQTPKAYRELYEGYRQTVQSYGVMVCETLREECTLKKDTGSVASVDGKQVIDKRAVYSAQGPAVTQIGQHQSTRFNEKESCEQNTSSQQVICYEKKYLADKDAYGIAEDAVVLVKRGTVISPLARDTLKSRRIELRQETEGGRL
jgi:hypothetical protein